MFRRIPWKKYNSVNIVINWVKFRSKLESNCYIYLKSNWYEIIEFEPEFILQKKFETNWKKYRQIKYVSDFLIKMNWYNLIIEIKWFETPVWKLKKKLFLFKLKEYEKKYWCKLYFIVAKSVKDLNNKLKESKKSIDINI